MVTPRARTCLRCYLWLGPPGAGKSTQARLLADRLQLPYISLGVLLHRIAADGSSREGERALRDWRIAPDSIVVPLVMTRLRQPDCQTGFVLDSFPKTVAQAEALRAAVPIGTTIHLTVPPAVSAARTSARGRPDDTATLLAERHAHYLRHIGPLCTFVRSHGLLHEINGTRDVDFVHARVSDACCLTTIASSTHASRP